MQAHPDEQPARAVRFIEIQPHALVIVFCGGDVRFCRRVFFQPLDEIRAERFKVAVRLEFKTQFGGFGGEIAGQIADSEAFYYLDAPIRRLGALSCPIPFNPNLERETFPTVDKIITQVKSLM